MMATGSCATITVGSCVAIVIVALVMAMAANLSSSSLLAARTSHVAAVQETLTRTTRELVERAKAAQLQVKDLDARRAQLRQVRRDVADAVDTNTLPEARQLARVVAQRLAAVKEALRAAAEATI
jgi:hypothetical protein